MQAADLRQSWGSAAEVILAPAPHLALYGEVVVWFHKVELFRREEENRMYRLSPTPEDLALHNSQRAQILRDVFDVPKPAH